MSFRIALSGLNAASSDLNVIANNIANVGTTGFKASRAEFADVFASSAQSLGSSRIGSGVRVSDVAQQFGQGNIEFTDNALDLAISGDGFFTLDDNGSQVYSRAGAFKVNRDGEVVNSLGQSLQVFPALAGGRFDTGSLTSLRLSSADNAPAATTGLDVEANLPASATVPPLAFDATDPETFNHTTSATVYDSLGASHAATLYFFKGAAPNTWDVHTAIDGNLVGGANTITYDSSGALTTPANGEIVLPTYTLANGAAPLDITLEMGASTQYGESFSVASLTQDGFATGRITGIEVTQEGIVQARYSNGQSNALGQVALTRFANPQGLEQLGDSTWGSTFAAGQPLRGSAGSSDLGLIQSGALEGSNVDLTEQLVDMITAQRNFQANSQMISTADTITQTIINLR